VTDPHPAWDPWTDQSYLRESQYKTDVNLAARQSVYAYQQPRIDLVRETLGLPWAGRRSGRASRSAWTPASSCCVPSSRP
jgi:hypothetical protein